MLSDSQLVTFKADLDSNPEVADFIATGNNTAIRDYYNDTASPDFWVFKSSVSTDAVSKVIDWNEVLTGSPVSDIKQWGFDVIMRNGSIDPRLENIRDGLSTIFSGQTNTRSAILAEATRLASRVEKLFAVAATGPGGGDGSVQTQSAIAVFEGSITLDDVRNALNLP